MFLLHPLFNQKLLFSTPTLHLPFGKSIKKYHLSHPEPFGPSVKGTVKAESWEIFKLLWGFICLFAFPSCTEVKRGLYKLNNFKIFHVLAGG